MAGYIIVAAICLSVGACAGILLSGMMTGSSIESKTRDAFDDGYSFGYEKAKSEKSDK